MGQIYLKKVVLTDISDLINEMNREGKQIPRTVEEIAGFPFSSYEELQKNVKDGNAILQRFSFEYLGYLIQPLNPTAAWGVDVVIMYLLPVLSLLFAIIYSWWGILGLLLFFVGKSRTKRRYNETIFAAAMTNELVFCFLFYLRQVSVCKASFFYPEILVQYYYDNDKSVTKQLEMDK